MPEFRVYDKELKRKYTISAFSEEQIDPEVYDVLDEPTSDHLGPLDVEFDVTKSGKPAASSPAPVKENS
jgi:hypothetical protein